MWVFTVDGFYSAVENKDDPSLLTVRTRTRQDAANLQGALARIRCHVEVVATPLADYGWRLFVPRDKWATYLHNVVEAIDYTNFKDEVAKVQGQKRADVYHDVWATMWDLQRG
jgi:hypothetical protein